mgnify:CR=1 FL=1
MSVFVTILISNGQNILSLLSELIISKAWLEFNIYDMALPKIVQYIQKLIVKYTVRESEESPYDPEFVEMVQESRKGKSTTINPNNIWENIL